MKVKILVEVDAKLTNTNGSRAFLVATRVGGVMECPNITYENYQIIYADSEEEAVVKYNKLNSCDYFYGEVIKELGLEER